MLIVIGVIIILLSLLIVGLNMAAKAAQKAHTHSLMTSLAQGLVRFKDDVGYYPPVLNADRVLLEGPLPGSSSYDEDIQDWYSWTSLAEYLIGYGSHREDGYGYDGNLPPIFDWDQEQPPTGIRHPRADGVWGATAFTGLVADRMRDSGGNYGSETAPHPFDQGKVYGPYLELEDRDLLGCLVLVAGEYVVRFQGEAGYDEDAPKVITDYWGEPIYYFRRNYPPGALAQSYRAMDYDLDGRPDPVRTLSDVFCLRPYELDIGADVDSAQITADDSGDRTTTYRLESAEFALFSRGADQVFDPLSRRDPDNSDEPNRDNIVEVGP
jgi:hypothetical protein